MTTCCTGQTHKGTPKGRVETLHTFPTYIADPPTGEPKGSITIVPDAFGWDFINNRLLADVYAERIGARVLLPDVMDGNSADPSLMGHLEKMTDSNASYVSRILPGIKAMSGMAPFLIQNRPAVSLPRVVRFLTELRKGTELPVGVAGFCWGGKIVVLLAHGSHQLDGKPLCDVAFTAHPSGLTLPGDVEKVTLPLSVSVGTDDFVLPMAGVKKIQSVFEKKNAASEDAGRLEITTVEGARHGFACRADPEDETQAKQTKIAEDQAVEWFGNWFDKLRSK